MYIASALRRKRDEIAATIAVFEARIVAARSELAALEQSARLFDPEDGGDESALHREFAAPRKREQIPAAQCEESDNQVAKSIDVQKPQFTGEVAHSVTESEGGQIPEEFFYLDWP